MVKKANQNCQNCGGLLPEKAQYCGSCGQKVLGEEIRMRTFFNQFLSDYFTFDSKFFNSVIPLLIKPGHLTTEFFAGRRARYIAPLRLYIFISIVFFLLLELMNPGEGAEDVDRLISVYFPRLFFVLLPVFAALLQLLNLRKRKTYVLYFLFTVHFHAFLFLIATIYLLISEVFGMFDLIGVNKVLAAIVFLIAAVHLFIGIKRVLDLRFGRAMLVYLAFVIMYGGVLTLASLATLLFLVE
jgi:hypothetical protein